jgi:hypothetical protein
MDSLGSLGMCGIDHAWVEGGGQLRAIVGDSNMGVRGGGTNM